MSEVEHHGGISRRTLVKSTAIGSLALAAGGIALPFGLKSAAAAVQTAIQPAEDKVVWGACSVTAVAAARYVCTFAMTKSTGLKRIIPARIFTATIRFAPVCEAVQFAVALITQTV